MSRITSYSVYHLKNIIRTGKRLKKGGVPTYPTQRYEQELENRKTRNHTKGYENGYYYSPGQGRWIRLNRKYAIRQMEKFGRDSHPKMELLDKYINITRK